MSTQIKIDNISLSFDDFSVLKDVSIEIGDKDFFGIIGPNGGGKTSLLRIILGLQKPTGGRIEFYKGGSRVKSLNMGYLPQRRMIDYKFPISVSETIYSGIMEGGVLLSRFSAEQKSDVSRLIEQLGLKELQDKPVGQLSGGQLQRVLLGRALVSRPDVLILDEPTSYIDKTFEAQLFDLLNEVNKSTTILFVSHEVELLSKYANHMVKINNGAEQLF